MDGAIITTREELSERFRAPKKKEKKKIPIKSDLY